MQTNDTMLSETGNLSSDESNLSCVLHLLKFGLSLKIVGMKFVSICGYACFGWVEHMYEYCFFYLEMSCRCRRYLDNSVLVGFVVISQIIFQRECMIGQD